MTSTSNQVAKNKQLSREVENSNTCEGKHDVKAVEDDEEDSEDQGFSFDDIISLGRQHRNFGSFQDMEINNLWIMKLQDNKSVVINEYGSNLLSYKYDPLAVVEAKKSISLWPTVRTLVHKDNYQGSQLKKLTNGETKTKLNV